MAAGPGILKPLPVLGPSFEAIRHFSDRELLPGLFQTGIAASDALGLRTGMMVLGAVERGTAWNPGRMTAEAVRKQSRRRGVAGPGQEINHSIELAGIPRTAVNWRNHPAFLKILPQADHRRLRGKWGNLPRYGPVQRLLVGTPDWMKEVPSAIALRAPDVVARLFPDAPADQAERTGRSPR